MFQGSKMRGWRTTAMAGAMTLLLTGCSGFFPPLSDSGSGSGSSGTTNYAYVANATTNNLAAYSIATNSSGTGTLTAISGSPYSLSFQPTSIVVTPNNEYLYVAGLGGIYAYSINSSTGALTIANSGGAVAVTTLASISMAVSPDGQWLFALSQDGATFNEYQISYSTGTLSILATPTYTAAGGATASPKMIKVAPNGAYVFAAIGTGGDLVFTLTTSTGALGSTYQQLAAPDAKTSDNALTTDANTTYLYIARSGNTTGVAAYTIGTNGTLTALAGSPFAAGAGPYSVMIDSTGKYLYSANRTDGTISAYTIGTTGGLTAIASSPYASGSLVSSLAEDSSDKYVLAAASGGSPDLTMYSFDATTLGQLDTVTTTSTGQDPTGALMVATTH